MGFMGANVSHWAMGRELNEPFLLLYIRRNPDSIYYGLRYGQ